MTRSAARDGCLQQGDGFVLVFALNSRGSLQVLAHLQQQILQVKDADTFPMLVVGNKSDLDAERQVSSAGMRVRWRSSEAQRAAKSRAPLAAGTWRRRQSCDTTSRRSFTGSCATSARTGGRTRRTASRRDVI